MKNSNKAFTLIELLVVVLIIGILAAVALPQYNKAVLKARLTEAISFGNTAEKAIQVWVMENGFPAAGDEEISFLGNNANGSLNIELPPSSQWFNYNVYTAPGESIEWMAAPRWFSYSSPNYIGGTINPDGSIDRTCWGMETEGSRMCHILDSLQPNTWTIVE